MLFRFYLEFIQKANYHACSLDYIQKAKYVPKNPSMCAHVCILNRDGNVKKKVKKFIQIEIKK